MVHSGGRLESEADLYKYLCPNATVYGNRRQAGSRVHWGSSLESEADTNIYVSMLYSINMNYIINKIYKHWDMHVNQYSNLP